MKYGVVEKRNDKKWLVGYANKVTEFAERIIERYPQVNIITDKVSMEEARPGLYLLIGYSNLALVQVEQNTPSASPNSETSECTNSDSKMKKIKSKSGSEIKESELDILPKVSVHTVATWELIPNMTSSTAA